MSIKDYVIFALMMAGLPAIYWGLLQWYKANFEEEKNRLRQPLKSVFEIIVMIFSELALLRITCEYAQASISGMIFALMYVTLVIMTVLCVTDYWEKVVPNKILLLYFFLSVIVLGFQGVQDIEVLMRELPSMVLGILFCMITFGLAFLLSRGSMGSGDVKLAILLGVFLTGNYIVRTVFYGCLVSALYSLIQLARKKLTRKDELPFVPFLYIGLIITYFMG